MAAIFFFSSLPSNEVKVISAQFTRLTPRTIPLSVGHASATIDWLKVGHFIGYLGLGAALLYALLPYTRFAGWWALGAAALYATSDEFHQTFVPGRHAGLKDVALDTGAACLAILVFYAIRRLKRHSAL